MDHIVRRLSPGELAPVPDDIEYPPAVIRRDEELTVGCQKSLGVQPRVLLTWSAPAECWRQGFKLLIFRSATSFAANEETQNLSEHGHMILEERADGQLEEHLPEGTHFYTFLLYRRILFGLLRKSCAVRFSETIPSLKVAVGRIEDRVKLDRMKSQHGRDLMLDQVAENEAKLRLHQSNRRLQNAIEPRPEVDPVEEAMRRSIEPIVRKALVKARTRVEMAVQYDLLRKTLKRRPDWKALTREQRERILRDIAADLDADEALFNA